ncbi:hypothetical protein DFH06DRAFT_1402574 [Mycena polygramma]|nr:hypothetical protein DFH06DRAFT_1402574 [Mycena polygramma]
MAVTITPLLSLSATMVLTRRGHKSIVRWEVMGYASPMTLVGLCSTSRLMSALATPLLYRTGYLRNSKRIRILPPRCAHMKARTIRARDMYGNSQSLWVFMLPDEVADDVVSMLPTLKNLCSLVILWFNKVPELLSLRRSPFPNLRTFKYRVYNCKFPNGEFQNSIGLITPFINCHPAITFLSLTRSKLMFSLGPPLVPGRNEKRKRKRGCVWPHQSAVRRPRGHRHARLTSLGLSRRSRLIPAALCNDRAKHPLSPQQSSLLTFHVRILLGKLEHNA